MFVLAFSVVEMMAALFRLDWLRSVIPGAPKMTVPAALLFTASSLLVLGFHSARRRDPLGAFVIGTLTLAILMTVVFECALYVSGHFVFDIAAMSNLASRHPSPCALAGFALVAAGGFAWAFRWWWTLRFLGGASAVIGVLALAGYVFNVPRLYCYFGPDSTAMAVPTAFCLLVVGTCEALTFDADEVLHAG